MYYDNNYADYAAEQAQQEGQLQQFLEDQAQQEGQLQQFLEAEAEDQAYAEFMMSEGYF
ncbi:MAG: hypothetical protein ACK5LR_07460 [Mangrovibacterium sp.]